VIADNVFVSPGAVLLINDNSGLVTKRISIDLGGTVVNQGTITMDDQNLGQGQPLEISNSGIFNNLTNGRVFIQDVYGGSAILNTIHGGFENDGEIHIMNTGTIAPVIDNRNLFFNNNLITISNAGNTAIFSRGSITNTGRIEVTNAPQGFISASFGSFNNSPTGSLLYTGTGIGRIGISNSLVFTNSGDIQLFSAQPFDIICTTGATINFSDGTIGGTGTIRWCNTNIGSDLAPGNSPGRITVASDLIFSGVYEVEIAGLGGRAQPDGHDHLQIDGNLSFNGEISVSLIDDFIPENGDRFEIINCGGACAGNYDNVIVGGGSNWIIDAQNNSVWLEYNNVALPVMLANFTGRRVAAKEVSLTWATSFEIENSGFGLERSTNGQDWEEIAFINAIENNRDTYYERTYFFSDDLPSTDAYYYRLRQVDFNGSTTFSNFIYVPGVSTAIEIFPNPIASGEYLTIANTSHQNPELYGKIITSIGEEIVGEFAIPAGNHQIKLPDLGQGMYFLVVEGLNGSYFVQRLLVNTQ